MLQPFPFSHTNEPTDTLFALYRVLTPLVNTLLDAPPISHARLRRDNTGS